MQKEEASKVAEKHMFGTRDVMLMSEFVKRECLETMLLTCASTGYTVSEFLNKCLFVRPDMISVAKFKVEVEILKR